MAELYPVPPDQLALVWEDVARLLETQGVDAQALRPLITLEQKQLWIATEFQPRLEFLAAVLTWVEADTLIIHLAAGRQLEKWIPSTEAVLKKLRLPKLRRVRILARKGWTAYALLMHVWAEGLDFEVMRDRRTAREPRLEPRQRYLRARSQKGSL